jgi:transcriptional regulator with XRE-family HTH domain
VTLSTKRVLSVALIKRKVVWYREANRSTKGWGAQPVVQIADKFEHFLEVYRRPDGSRWGGQDLDEATGGVVTRSYVSNLRKGRIENPGFDKLRAIAKAMNFPPELWFEDVENLRDVSAVRPSWFVDDEDNLALLDEELLEALRDETARAVLREVIRLPERDRRIVLGIVRQFQGMSG